jgi:hypothetical protein
LTPQKDSLVNEEQIPKLEKRHQSIPLSELEIRQYHFLKEKFDRKQPIDVVFGMKKDTKLPYNDP